MVKTMGSIDTSFTVKIMRLTWIMNVAHDGLHENTKSWTWRTKEWQSVKVTGHKWTTRQAGEVMERMERRIYSVERP